MQWQFRLAWQRNRRWISIVHRIIVVVGHIPVSVVVAMGGGIHGRLLQLHLHGLVHRRPRGRLPVLPLREFSQCHLHVPRVRGKVPFVAVLRELFLQVVVVVQVRRDGQVTLPAPLLQLFQRQVEVLASSLQNVMGALLLLLVGCTTFCRSRSSQSEQYLNRFQRQFDGAVAQHQVQGCETALVRVRYRLGMLVNEHLQNGRVRRRGRHEVKGQASAIVGRAGAVRVHVQERADQKGGRRRQAEAGNVERRPPVRVLRIDGARQGGFQTEQVQSVAPRNIVRGGRFAAQVVQSHVVWLTFAVALVEVVFFVIVLDRRVGFTGAPRRVDTITAVGARFVKVLQQLSLGVGCGATRLRFWLCWRIITIR